MKVSEMEICDSHCGYKRLLVNGKRAKDDEAAKTIETALRQLIKKQMRKGTN